MYVKAKGVFFHYPHFLRQCLLLNLALTDLGRQLLQRPVSTFSSLGLQTSTTAPGFWEDLGDPNSARVGAYISTRTYTFSLSLTKSPIPTSSPYPFCLEGKLKTDSTRHFRNDRVRDVYHCVSLPWPQVPLVLRLVNRDLRDQCLCTFLFYGGKKQSLLPSYMVL